MKMTTVESMPSREDYSDIYEAIEKMKPGGKAVCWEFADSQSAKRARVAIDRWRWRNGYGEKLAVALSGNSVFLQRKG